MLVAFTAPVLAGGYDDVGDDGDGYGGYGATVVVTKRVIYPPPQPVYHVRRVIYAPAPYYGTTDRHYGGYRVYGVHRAYWGSPGGGYYGVRRAYWGGPGGGYYGVRRAYWGGPGGGYYGCAGVSLGD